jgi:beta-glucuronidase
MWPVRRRMLLLVGAGLLLLGAIVGSAGRAPAEKAKLAASTRKSVNQGGSIGPAVPRPPAPVSLDTGWRYLPDPHNLGIAEDWGGGGAASQPWAPVAIPDDFNPTVSTTSDSPTVGWYEVQFTGPPITAGRSWRVAFESVRRNAQVWLNGYEIGANSDPYAPFSVPATSLIPGGPNLLVVRVDNVRGGGALPEDWWDWGGIMGPVSLQPAGRLSLKDLGVLPELGCAFHCGDLLVQGTLTNNTAVALGSDVVVKVTAPGGAGWSSRHRAPKLSGGTSEAISFRVPVRGQPALWSPSNPALYTVEVETVVGSRVEDDDTVHTGMRSVQVRGGLLYLNGHRLWLRGAAIHEDVDGRGAALADGDIDTIVSQLRSLGANVTRAHYLLSPRMLDALDAAGIMVWAQPPVDHADSWLKSAAGRRLALSTLRSTLIGDRNHPSVIIDSVGNELSPNPDATPGTNSYLTQATALARRLNPVVPVALDTYCYPGFPVQKIYSKVNVLGISSYFGWYPGLRGHSIASFGGLEPFLRQSHSRYPKLALAVSEYGAESLFNGPATVKGTYEFQSNYVQQTVATVNRLPFMNGTIYWTLREFAISPGWTGGVTLPAGATPDGLHHKGLIAYDDTQKPAFLVAQKLFATQPRFVH